MPSDVTNKARILVWQQCPMHHQTITFCSSMVKPEPKKKKKKKRDSQHLFTHFFILVFKNQCLKVIQTWPWMLPFCAQESVSVTSLTRPGCVATVPHASQPTIFCSSFVKREPSWLHPNSSNLKPKKCFFCINTNKTIKCVQMEYLHSFCFRPSSGFDLVPLYLV